MSLDKWYNRNKKKGTKLPDIHVPISIAWKLLKGITKCAMHPKETCAISTNMIYWLAKYHIKRDKAQNYVINRRVTDHTILQDGTLITHTRYSITMLDNCTLFSMKKFYGSDNNELEHEIRKVDMEHYIDIYKELNEHVRENRFKDYLIVCELIDGPRKGSKFIPKITNKTPEKLEYVIEYSNLKIFDTFEFFVSITVPREFDRSNMYDQLGIDPVYGIFDFTSKVDKQRKNSNKYLPKIRQGNKIIDSKPVDNIFYTGESWRLFNPKASRLETEE